MRPSDLEPYYHDRASLLRAIRRYRPSGLGGHWDNVPPQARDRGDWRPLIRSKLLQRDQHACADCSLEMALRPWNDWGDHWDPRFHVDHVVPLAAGGPHDIQNMQILCASCHRAKSGREARARREAAAA